MDRTQSLEEFYKAKFNWIPDNIRKEIGHFNVFRLDDFVGRHSKPIPYSRKDYFKISLIIGKNQVHYTLKMPPATNVQKQQTHASYRTAILFLELLERQFPIEDVRQRLNFRSPSDFARQLSIHVNHLNKVVKETTEKTTSEIIAERVLQEAKILLKHTEWNVSEIAFTLGFMEVTHFNNFFKKHLHINPTQFRNI